MFKYSSDSSLVWTLENCTVLFNIRSDMEEDVCKAKNHQTLWGVVSKKLKASGCDASLMQCTNKRKNLKREFMKCADHKSRTGETPKRCKFYEEFSGLYGCRSSTRPKTTIASATTASDQHVTPIKKTHKRKLNETPTLTFRKAESKRRLTKKGMMIPKKTQ